MVDKIIDDILDLFKIFEIKIKELEKRIEKLEKEQSDYVLKY